VQSIFWVLASIVAGYLILILLIYFMQSNLVYHPQKNILVTPSNLGLQYEDVTFHTDDEVALHGWFVPKDSVKVTVLYFHGNAGNISGRMQTIQLLHQIGLNVFIFDYRGYGQSQGRPSEKGTYQDAEAAWQYLTMNRHIADSNIVIMGRSLGGSVAAWLSARQNSAAVVIESTFTSAGDLGADLYPWLPVRWMIQYEYNTLDYLEQIESPIFMAHSRDDQIVPFHHGKTLFKSAKDPKTFVELEGTHGSGFWETGAKYQSSLQQFLEQHTPLNSESFK
jgi:fermentation-respiration switch protein FrsA (DUF1100 family)